LGYDAGLLDALQTETRQMTLGEKVAEVRALQSHGGDHKSEEFQSTESTLKRGGNPFYRIARLKRDYPAIAKALAEGKYPSVYAAAKAAGLVRDLTPLDYLHRYWHQVSPDDRLRFLTEMLTPQERRALTCGIEEEAPDAGL
jgi:hypothetical protein